MLSSWEVLERLHYYSLPGKLLRYTDQGRPTGIQENTLGGGWNNGKKTWGQTDRSLNPGSSLY